MNRIIHTTWARKRLPRLLESCVQSFVAWNPDWEVRLYDRGQRDRFVAETFGEDKVGYHACDLATQVDLFRVMILYRHGGVFVDPGIVCLDSLNRLLERVQQQEWQVLLATDHPVYASQDGSGKGAWVSDFMVAEPESVFLKEVIDHYLLLLSEGNRKGLRFDAIINQVLGVSGTPENLKQIPWQWIHPLPDMSRTFSELAGTDREIRGGRWREKYNPVVVNTWHQPDQMVNTMLERYHPFLFQTEGEIAETRLQIYIDLLDKRLNTMGLALAEFADRGGGRLVELGMMRSFVSGEQEGCEVVDPMYWHPETPGNWDWGAGSFTKVAAEVLKSLSMEYIGVDPNPDAHVISGTAVKGTEGIYFDGAIADSGRLARDYQVLRSNTTMRFLLETSSRFLLKQSEPIALLYMDHGECGEEAAMMHRRDAELVVSKGLIPPGGMILIDDHRPDKGQVPKSKYSLPYLLDAGFQVMEEGYQILLERIDVTEVVPRIIHLFPTDHREPEFSEELNRVKQYLGESGLSYLEWSYDALDRWIDEEANDEIAETYLRLDPKSRLRFGRYAVASVFGGFVMSGVYLPSLSRMTDFFKSKSLLFFKSAEWKEPPLDYDDGLFHEMMVSIPNHPFWNGLASDALMAYRLNDCESLGTKFLTERVRTMTRFLKPEHYPRALWEPVFSGKHLKTVNIGDGVPSLDERKIHYARQLGKERGFAGRSVLAYTFRPDCGLGQAAEQNIEVMRTLGLQVDHRLWLSEKESAAHLLDDDTIVYHHWHPQPHDKGREWNQEFFDRGRHIAFWAYESINVKLPEFANLAPLMSEIWVPSNFCGEIFRHMNRPIKVVPHAVPIPDRAMDLLPFQRKDKPLNVLYLFDAWSRLPRKNPEAVIETFQRAFEDRHDVVLTLKAHHLDFNDEKKLRRLCHCDGRIRVINEYLSDTDLDALFMEADILLSLQRSEGFGLNIARALGYGVPVITTGFGGHLDYCDQENSFLIPWTLMSVAQCGDDFYREGNWADPDLDAATAVLRKVADMIASRSPELDEKRKKGSDRVRNELNVRCLTDCIADAVGAALLKD